MNRAGAVTMVAMSDISPSPVNSTLASLFALAHLVRQQAEEGDVYDVKVRAGATLLYDSEPAAEFAETEGKARALLEALDSVDDSI